jgi:hypothetical protein
MTRRRHPMSTDHLFMPVRLSEHYRRTVDYLQAHRALLVAAGSGKREIVTLDDTIRNMAGIVAMSDVFPPDTPQPRPAPELPPQPLVMPGTEEFMHDFIDGLAS